MNYYFGLFMYVWGLQICLNDMTHIIIMRTASWFNGYLYPVGAS